MTLLLQRKQYRSYRRKAVLKRMWRRVRALVQLWLGLDSGSGPEWRNDIFFIGKQDDPDRDPRGF